jgi:hypothetical protein
VYLFFHYYIYSMEVKTTIEIEAWADYDISYTKYIMVSEEERDVKSIVQAYCSLRGLPSTKGLPDNMLNDLPDDFAEYLRKHEGFKQLKTKKVCFSD